MANVVIASGDSICQSAKKWFVDTRKAVADNLNELENNNKPQGGPDNLNELKNINILYVIAHDDELRDGTGLIEWFLIQDFPMTNWACVLIVCSAASMNYSKDLCTPAEAIANYIGRTVYASKTVVIGKWDITNGNAQFTGDWVEVKPGDDITSKMEKLSIND